MLSPKQGGRIEEYEWRYTNAIIPITMRNPFRKKKEDDEIILYYIDLHYPFYHRFRDPEFLETVREVDRLIDEGYDPRNDPEYTASRNRKPYVKPDYGNTKYALNETPSYLRGRDRMAKRGADLAELDLVIGMLLHGIRLPKSYRAHKLKGNRKGQTECHISDDWILTYRYDEDKLILTALGTGTHRDLGLERTASFSKGRSTWRRSIATSPSADAVRLGLLAPMAYRGSDWNPYGIRNRSLRMHIYDTIVSKIVRNPFRKKKDDDEVLLYYIDRHYPFYHRFRDPEFLETVKEVDRLIDEGYDPRNDPEYIASRSRKPYVKPDYGNTKYALNETPSYLRGRDRMAKRGADLSRLDYVIAILLHGDPLPKSYRTHRLKGNLKGQTECHISDDWILTYRYDEDKLILTALGTGTHRDLGLKRNGSRSFIEDCTIQSRYRWRYYRRLREKNHLRFFDSTVRPISVLKSSAALRMSGISSVRNVQMKPRPHFRTGAR